ncbi:hypothetical protein, partial [Listeria seeligeri]|uniref:hypothetical protein n=1 Tax=Listeria seeligeri TaxID=1640 RepID=UPI0022EB577F
AGKRLLQRRLQVDGEARYLRVLAQGDARLPTLRSVRDALREAGADTDVVYVSLDESEAALWRYMHAQDMPWPVLDPRRAKRMPALQALAGLGPPNLV